MKHPFTLFAALLLALLATVLPAARLLASSAPAAAATAPTAATPLTAMSAMSAKSEKTTLVDLNSLIAAAGSGLPRATEMTRILDSEPFK